MCDLSKVLVIVIAFNSDVSELQSNLQVLVRKVDILICDNSTIPDCRSRIRAFAESQAMRYMSMGMNAGIGYAQNRAFEFAIKEGYSSVLLLDDDSRISLEGLSDLVQIEQHLLQRGSRIAAVCAQPAPSHRDVASRQDIAHLRGGYEVRRIRDMMSSGSLMPISVLQNIGGMDEELFVDYVDYDWGWRAQAKGFSLFTVPSVHLEHKLGEGDERIIGLKIKLKPPVRHYYQARNCLLLLSRDYVPIGWKFKQLVLLFARCGMFSLFVNPRRERLAYSIRGFLDGLKSRGKPEIVMF